MNDQVLRIHASRSRRAFLFWILGAAFFLLLPVALLLLYRTVAEAELRETMAELEAAGMMLSGEAVNRHYHGHGFDPAGNAAPMYERAFARLAGEPMAALTELLRLRATLEPIDRETMAAIADVIDANQASLDLLREAAAYPYLRHALDFTEGVNLLLPHLSQFREGARLLAAEAIFAAEQGDPDRAAEAVQTIFRIALHIEQEPTLISQLTRIAIEGIGRTALERVLDQVELPPAALAELQQLLHTLATGPRMQGGLPGEVAFGMSAYDLIEQGESGILDGEIARLEGILLPFYRMSGLMARDKRYYLMHMEEILRLAALPVAERLSATWPEPDFSANPLHGQVVISIILPTLERVIEADNRAITSLRATRIALAAERYRLEQGELPSTPEDLMPNYLEELPLDPYNENANFQFVREEDGFFVRSRMSFSLSREEGDIFLQFRLPLKRAEEK